MSREYFKRYEQPGRLVLIGPGVSKERIKEILSAELAPGSTGPVAVANIISDNIDERKSKRERNKRL